MKENFDIEQLYKDNLKDFEALPPKDAWGAISSKLDQRQSGYYKFNSRVICFDLIAASVFLAMLLFPNYSIVDYSDDTSNIVDKIRVENDSIEESINSAMSNESQISSRVPDLGLKDTFSQQRSYNYNTYTNKVDVNDENLLIAPSVLLYLYQAQTYQKYAEFHSEIKPTFVEHNVTELNKVKVHKETKPKAITNYKELYVEPSIEVLENKSITNTNHQVQDRNQLGGAFIPKYFRYDNLFMSQEIDYLSLRYDISNSLSVLGQNQFKGDSSKAESTKKIIEKENYQWELQTVIAPYRFSSITGGSSIDQQLADKAKTYATSVAYGIGVSRKLGKKFRIRTGLQSIIWDHTTEDIYYNVKFRPSNLDNLPLISKDTNHQIINIYSEAQDPDYPYINDRKQGSLTQKIRYLEIPLEFSYSFLSDKKYNLELISGVSSFFLQQDFVRLNTQTSKFILGQSNNLNDFHLSANFAIGFKYSIFDHINLNIQPTFKYHLNTFSLNPGNFTPVNFGVQSGVSYQF